MENGDSLGEKEEVRKRRLMIKRLTSLWISFFYLSKFVPLRGELNCSLLPHFVFPRLVLLLTTTAINDSNGERISRQQMFGSPSTPILENPEYQTRWYFKYFLGKRKLSAEYICNKRLT